jgi:hypothetical protein
MDPDPDSGDLKNMRIRIPNTGTRNHFMIFLIHADFSRGRYRMQNAKKKLLYFVSHAFHSHPILKARSTVWHLAKKISLTAGQTDIRWELLLTFIFSITF